MVRTALIAFATAAFTFQSPYLKAVEAMNEKLISVDEESAHVVACHLRTKEWRVLLDQRVRAQIVRGGYLDMARQLSLPENMDAERQGRLVQKFHRDDPLPCASLAKMPFIAFYDQIVRGESQLP